MSQILYNQKYLINNLFGLFIIIFYIYNNNYYI